MGGAGPSSQETSYSTHHLECDEQLEEEQEEEQEEEEQEKHEQERRRETSANSFTFDSVASKAREPAVAACYRRGDTKVWRQQPAELLRFGGVLL